MIIFKRMCRMGYKHDFPDYPCKLCNAKYLLGLNMEIWNWAGIVVIATMFVSSIVMALYE